MPEGSLPKLSKMNGSASEDGKFVMLQLIASNKNEITVALEDEQLTKAVGFMIGLAQECGTRRAANIEVGESITAHPIDVAAIALAPGRRDTETILAMRLGILTLNFALEVSTLREMCASLLAKTASGPTSPKLH